MSPAETSVERNGDTRPVFLTRASESSGPRSLGDGYPIGCGNHLHAAGFIFDIEHVGRAISHDTAYAGAMRAAIGLRGVAQQLHPIAPAHDEARVEAPSPRGLAALGPGHGSCR